MMAVTAVWRILASCEETVCAGVHIRTRTFFFFQAEDGIRDVAVTGVQTCALPICDVPMAVNTMKKGALDFIQKPFNEEELLNLVERMLDHAREAFAGHQQAASQIGRASCRERV